jgi:hypothetical protein
LKVESVANPVDEPPQEGGLADNAPFHRCIARETGVSEIGRRCISNERQENPRIISAACLVIAIVSASQSRITRALKPSPSCPALPTSCRIASESCIATASSWSDRIEAGN